MKEELTILEINEKNLKLCEEKRLTHKNEARIKI